ncbi:MAG: hypothetical protein GXY18_13840 [Methanomicrobiales archaeon]|nr:hypothetical protein [Methanomicrobiales archaeon]
MATIGIIGFGVLTWSINHAGRHAERQSETYRSRNFRMGRSDPRCARLIMSGSE